MEDLVIYTDGASRGNPGPAGYAVVVYRENKMIFKTAVSIGKTTNNVAEYLGCIAALIAGIRLRAQRVVIKTDSQLLQRQVNGDYRTKDEWLQRLGLIVRNLMACFDRVDIVHVPREENREADSLVAAEIERHGGGTLF